MSLLNTVVNHSLTADSSSKSLPRLDFYDRVFVFVLRPGWPVEIPKFEL